MDIQPPKDAVVVKVNGITLDPFKHYAVDASHTDHIIVGLHKILTNDEQKKLEKKHVKILEDLGSFNYLCHFTPKDLTPLRKLGFVRQVDVYRNMMKIPKELRDILAEVRKSQPDDELIPCALDVMVHAVDADEAKIAEKLIAEAELDSETLVLSPGKIRLQASWTQLQTIIQNDKVRIIEEVVVPELHDSEAVSIVWAAKHSLKTTGSQSRGEALALKYRGKGQTIAVVDTGFDLGSINDCHPCFKGQVTKLISAGRASLESPDETKKVDDPSGHGTHVCGTIIARGVETDQGLVTGVAPEAKIVMTSLLADKRDIISVQNVGKIFQDTRDADNARIHTNSWGDGLGLGVTQRPYMSSAQAIDKFVCDNPDVLVVFSAGNNNLRMLEKAPKGVQKPSIGSQAAAKNCLTVGACGTTRTLTLAALGTDNKKTLEQELVVVGPDTVLEDSSRGPTAQARTKPDVVAPGYNIFSAFSRHPDVRYAAARAVSGEYANVLWKVRSGTSHATPLVAGCAAILREIALDSGGCDEKECPPPAALLKAVIINGANKLPGVDREAQGFGRVNLANSAAMMSVPVTRWESVSSTTTLSAIAGTMIGKPLAHLESFSFSLDSSSAGLDAGETVRGAAHELKITMVYNDLVGKEMQNNLNLAVIDHSADVLHPGWISEDEMDKQNNVEQVVLCPVPKTPVTVRITGQKMLTPKDGTQDFALAWSVTPVYKGFS